jgi:hypothetical protein
VDQQVSSPTADDLALLENWRDWTRGHFASEAAEKYNSVAGKLRLIQAVLDAGWVNRTEGDKLRCLGVTLGDAIAQKMQMEWVIVEDDSGRDPALRFPGTTVIAYPLSMISKRIDRGEVVDVADLFDGVCQHVLTMKSNPEYQRH